MRVALASTNQAKQKAAEGVFSRTFGARVEVSLISAASGVSETPTTDEEALAGCRTRIQRINETDFDYIVSMEGLAQKYSYGWFIYGMAVVWDCINHHEGIGCSAKVKIPENISRLIRPEAKLGDLVKTLYSTEKTKDLALIGTNGVITNGLFTRVDEFEGALRCALGFVLNKENYP